MLFFCKIYIALLASTLCSASILGIFQKRQDVSAQTTFKFGYDHGCDPQKVKIIKQFHKDALTLAHFALDNVRELGTTGKQDKEVDFHTQAAVDYWGPPYRNCPFQQRIFNTLYRATQSYRGSGWDDWWHNRYVFVNCKDFENHCVETSPAYTVTRSNRPYPDIVYCQPFFKNLASHSKLVAKIKADKFGQMKRNVRNLRSRATTPLHEWLHIKGYPSEVCAGGCDDTLQEIGQASKVELLTTYKAGLTKLLARRSPLKAANTNDNYAYSAMARFMEKTFKTYPEYPTAWDRLKTKSENEAIEKDQPGAPPKIQSWELEDSGVGNDTVTGPTFPAAAYPPWYQPIVNAGATNLLPPISAPQDRQVSLPEPNINSVVCETTGGSPLINDCVHAFGSLYQFPDNPTVRAK